MEGQGGNGFLGRKAEKAEEKAEEKKKTRFLGLRRQSAFQETIQLKKEIRYEGSEDEGVMTGRSKEGFSGPWQRERGLMTLREMQQLQKRAGGPNSKPWALTSLLPS